MATAPTRIKIYSTLCAALMPTPQPLARLVALSSSVRGSVPDLGHVGSPAQVLATQRMLEAKYNEAARGADDWARRAELAVRSNNDDLAREALRRKKAFSVRPAAQAPSGWPVPCLPARISPWPHIHAAIERIQPC